MTFSIKELAGDDFWRHNVTFFIGSLAVAVLNYLYYPVLGRLLNVSYFGEVQTLVSIFLQSTIFFSVIGLITVNVIANQRAKESGNQVIFELEKLSMIVALSGLAITCLLARQLQDFFHFSSFWPFIALALALVASVPLSFRQFYLRGRLLFGAASWSAAAAAAAKLALSALLVYAGYRSFGAIAGIVLAQLAALIYTHKRARQAGYVHTARSKWLDLKLIRPELTYGGLVLLVTIIVTLQFSLDIVVIKHYFTANSAGLYAGVTTVARIIYFMTASVSIVLMSLVKLDGNGRQNRLILKRSLALLLGLGLPTLFVFAVAPSFVINLLLGPHYLAYSGLLPKLSLAMLIVSAAGILFNYFLALRKYPVAIPAILGGVITYAIILRHHLSIPAVVDSLLWGSICMLVLVSGWGLMNLRGKVELINE